MGISNKEVVESAFENSLLDAITLEFYDGRLSKQDYGLLIEGILDEHRIEMQKAATQPDEDWRREEERDSK